MDRPDPITELDRRALGLRLEGARLGGAGTLGALLKQRTVMVFLRHGG